jgi:transposase-like protein
MAQRAPITQAEKQVISERKAAGESLRQISGELGCSIETVRKWWRCIRKGRKVAVRGRPKKGACSTYPKEVSGKAIELKQAHPHWGPKKVKVELKQELSLRGKKLPSPARLSALFKERCPEAVQVHQPRLLPPPDPSVRGVHQRWQMDAKDWIEVGSGRVNVQEIRDIYSGLMIASQAFVAPQIGKAWQRLHLEQHQAALRQAFSQWGLPLEVQTDNDGVFVNLVDPSFPSLFTLWLVGLGITHVLSRRKRPTDQAKVERNHRTQGDFVWKDQSFGQVERFQQALDYHRQVYNEAYPSQAEHCHGHSPLSVFPTARSTGRLYHPDVEWEMFNLDRVDAFLAQQVWTRKVAHNATVHLGDHYYILGKNWKALSVSIRFLPGSRSFHFQSADGSLSADLPALGLEKDQLIGSFPAHLPLPFGFQYVFPLPGV